MRPAPRCQVRPERKTSPPSNQEISTVSIGSGTRNGSPYISSLGSSIAVAEAGEDRVRAVDRPEPLALAGLAPAQGAGGAHQADEGLGEVARVQHDQAHALVHPGGHPGGDLVGDLAVRLVAPPDQHVGGVEPGLGQAVLGLVEGGGLGRDRRAPRPGRRRWWRGCRRDRCRGPPAFSRSWTNSFQTTARIMASPCSRTLAVPARANLPAKPARRKPQGGRTGRARARGAHACASG